MRQLMNIKNDIWSGWRLIMSNKTELKPTVKLNGDIITINDQLMINVPMSINAKDFDLTLVNALWSIINDLRELDKVSTDMLMVLTTERDALKAENERLRLGVQNLLEDRAEILGTIRDIARSM
jgi:hypothetical protein